MQVVDATFAESVAAELAAFGQNIISAAELSMQTISLYGALYDVKLTALVIACFGRHKREVEVAVVMVDSTAAGLATHQVSAVGFEGVHIHFAERILVLPYHHRTAVAPEIERNAIGTFHKVVLDRDVPIRLGLVGNDES